ncbi:hypothetical protein HMPREF1555_01093 [Porphyromonas gingivalis F0570]|uniref:Uncharacterized protein n=1 Tax=Porphyromonas gingivalis F0570 TaxID=1227271 RepID=A0A0E2LQZ2_PORGN|nr:hypothetical protein HMPREF1555_01093 [Porphyromonas gingivalis F0570]
MLLLYQLRKRLFRACDLYTNHLRSIYLLKTIYIQIVASLVLSGISICKSPFSHHFCLAFFFSTDTYLESFQTRLRC